MHYYMFLSLIGGLLGWSDIFGLALASTALLGVGRRCELSSYIFPYVSITVGYLPSVGLFIFTRYVSNILAF